MGRHKLNRDNTRRLAAQIKRRQCPITYGLPTKMFRSKFKEMCLRYYLGDDLQFTGIGRGNKNTEAELNRRPCLRCKIGKAIHEGRRWQRPPELCWIKKGENTWKSVHNSRTIAEKKESRSMHQLVGVG